MIAFFPFFHDIFPIIEDIFSNKEKDLSKFLGNSLQIFSKYLDINTKFEYSSMLENDKSLQAQDRLIEISKILNATDYINAIGGEQLYDKNAFSDAGINLSFIQKFLLSIKDKFLRICFLYFFQIFRAIVNLLNLRAPT